jgi:hypothetical protein
MPKESKTPEDYVSDALDLMVKAGWVNLDAYFATPEHFRMGYSILEECRYYS